MACHVFITSCELSGTQSKSLGNSISLCIPFRLKSRSALSILLPLEWHFSSLSCGISRWNELGRFARGCICSVRGTRSDVVRVRSLFFSLLFAVEPFPSCVSAALSLENLHAAIVALRPGKGEVLLPDAGWSSGTPAICMLLTLDQQSHFFQAVFANWTIRSVKTSCDSFSVIPCFASGYFGRIVAMCYLQSYGSHFSCTHAGTNHPTR